MVVRLFEEQQAAAPPAAGVLSIQITFTTLPDLLQGIRNIIGIILDRALNISW
jgi:hypothetical protein